MRERERESVKEQRPELVSSGAKGEVSVRRGEALVRGTGFRFVRM
jgi:hypothetical protein